MAEQIVARKSLQSVRIVVIGAGPSGIAAATKLIDAGFRNVVILEAENRIGGRIYTVPFADNVVDLGAQWCHGEKHNVVYETLQKERLNLVESTGDVYEDYKCIRSNKEIVPDDVAEKLKSIAFSTVPERQEGLVNYEGSLGSYLTEKYWSDISKLEPKVDRALAKEFFENFKKFESSVEASDHLFEVSGKGHLDYWICEGDLLLNWKDKGFKTFLELLLKSSVEKPFGILDGRIFLNQRVEQIDWSNPHNIRVKCSNGTVLTSDHVICTVSLGVLKELHGNMFIPSLPVSKVRSIEGLKLGTVDKFFLEFENPFGPSEWKGMCFLWLEEDLESLRDSNLFWLESVFGFYRVSHQPRVLQGWIIGPHARHMESLTEEEALGGILWLLRKFLNFNVPDPVGFKRTQWHANANFRGSYTFRTILSDELRTGAWDLAAPVTTIQGRPVLQFAGESTHNHYYSTVHGAVESGWREAQRLLELYTMIPSRL
ncbi:spermine oxidase [Musca vetustissima]|uniref:spermine oxidase n=1 Tax=Musca vetustissima TaxID=27455 RepID=UPI002AB5ECA1|nr:spermine oxidase [Musca vetustissima]